MSPHRGDPGAVRNRGFPWGLGPEVRSSPRGTGCSSYGTNSTRKNFNEFDAGKAMVVASPLETGITPHGVKDPSLLIHRALSKL